MVHFCVAVTRKNMNRCGGAPGISDGVLTGKCVSMECHRWGMCSFRFSLRKGQRSKQSAGERGWSVQRLSVLRRVQFFGGAEKVLLHLEMHDEDRDM